MAYDQFVAVCNPLLYTVAMSHKLCSLLVAGTYIQMACFVISTVNEVCSLLITLASYVFIIATVSRMPSKGGLRKAFSTCASHLTAISIFHGIILLLYCVPHDKSSWLLVKVDTVLFTVMIPMLNPLLYSLRNKDLLGMNSQISSNRSQMQHEGNQSTVFTFIFLGFSEYPKLQVPLFLIFLTIYTISVLENLGMILIIRINPKLHTPMYFFLSHLSFVDFCYTTTITPKLLDFLVVEDRSMSFKGCITQFFFGCTCVITQTFILAVMAYDRFVAVCNPLLYTVAMSRKLCALLVAGSYIWGGICSSTLTYFLLALSYCGSGIINHFCCEYSAIISASCSDSSLSQLACLVICMFNEICSLLIILTSYVVIVITVIKIPAKGGLRKAFSTCGSHLAAICFCHGVILLLYCVLKSKSSLLLVKFATVFYSMVIPMLNPLIYSLRNKDVKETLSKLMHLKVLSHS
ncbi:hypothetical protein GHT09_016803 [Marmota monax]|uniref:G-protein coupled receptors family 1 profile domain-containing protein n=1 Tax=Marmota monax TaxID=9995 RepID=A0A834UVI0_MARMO|nr:hypothetical protein GHT09_016803 [Marmota monax]